MRDFISSAAATWTSRKVASISATALLMLGGALAAGAVYAQLPPSQHYNQIEYVSGGIGIDESTAFKQAMPQYPLALTFASNIAEPGAYVADVQVVIRNEKGDTVLQAQSNGPYFLAKLPAGEYKIAATYKGKTITRSAKVGAKGSTRAMFEWQ
mgnify:FL=1